MIKQPSAQQAPTKRLADTSVASRLKLAIKANKWRLAFLAFAIVYAYILTSNLGYNTMQWDEMPHLYGGLLLSRGQTQAYLTICGYYPPLFDVITTGYLQLLGTTIFAGRLVSVTFSLLAIWLVFEFCNHLYGPKNALVASVLLGTMPGFLWASRVSMLETILMFFFTLVMFAFYWWISKGGNKALIFSGLALGIGILAKYELVVAAIAMLLSILFLCRKRLKISLAKFLLILVIVVLVVTPWFLMLYDNSGTAKFQAVVSGMQEGGQARSAYSSRFFIPVFYLIEMTWPYVTTHPVALPIFILGLCGLALFAYRRKSQDIFLLTWFIAVYVFFTFVPNKQWRYVDSLFPILAISAAYFIIFLYGKIHAWKPRPLGPNGNWLKKFAATFFIVLMALTVVYSSYNAYQLGFQGQFNVPVGEATNYIANHLSQNQSAVIVCASNVLDQDMFWFYLPANMSTNQVWQYPELPVDSYTPTFNITEFLSLCEQHNVKYIILFDYGPHYTFFNSTLDYTQVETMIYNTHRFGVPTDQPFFGEFSNNKGYRIFLVRFNQTQT
ncbi:MAG: glycosyltransferase family 39 protein [Candidatus Bathyarchaeia archaeon]|jgi:4-amino-4-deoxy-L-arabinose transferase-like glycosyltransferase